MPVRRTYRRRIVRRTGLRAAAIGGASMAYQGLRKYGSYLAKGIRRTQRVGNLVRYGKNFVKRTAKGELGKAVMGEVDGGDYSQFTSKSIVTGRKEKLSLRALDARVRKAIEPTIFRWNGVKVFDDNGYYYLNRNVSNATISQLPLYVYDLTAVNNIISGVYTGAQPMLRCDVVKASGLVQWEVADNYMNDGVTQVTTLQNEKYNNTTQLNMPLEKSRLRWTDVRMSLWGAKNKATKFIIQLVKVLDNDLDPFEKLAGRVNDVKHTAFWQSVLKPLTFNPISTSGADQHLKSKIKVLKTFTKIIQPTSTTESDIDPHAFIFKWFMRWNRDLLYNQNGSTLGTYNDLANQADYAIDAMVHSNAPKPEHKIFLIIRSNAYFDVTTFDNAISPSFDLSVRTCHEVNN